MMTTRLEIGLLLAFAGALLWAVFGPAVPQHAHYHDFADARVWLGVPCALDVLSNLPFAVGGLWGLATLQRLQPGAKAGGQQHLAALFFIGLVLTALCSGFYHLHPDNAGLVIDRLGMVVAFAGLLAVAVADRVSARAGVLTAATVLLLGPLSIWAWAASGNLLSWVVLQAGGVLLMLTLASFRPVVGAWGVSLGVVVTFYALAKVLELSDHLVFEWTDGLVSGHSLKHVVAALAARPVIRAVHNVAQTRNEEAL